MVKVTRRDKKLTDNARSSKCALTKSLFPTLVLVGLLRTAHVKRPVAESFCLSLSFFPLLSSSMWVCVFVAHEQLQQFLPIYRKRSLKKKLRRKEGGETEKL